MPFQDRPYHRSRPLVQAIRAALFCLPLATLVAAPAALAQSAASEQSVRSYEIPAGPLSSALSRFAGKAGVMLSVDGSLLEGRQSGGLSGQYGVDEGFDALLQSSGLQAVRNAQGTYSLAPRAEQASKVELKPMVVEGFALGNALGEMEGYNATHSSVATKTSMPLVRTSQSVSVVTRQQIDDQGSQTVSEAIRYAPGVVTNPYGATRRYDYVAMRGFNDGSVDNIIVDGLKSMSDAGTFSSLQVDPYFIERIDVLKGPSSVLYGRSNPGGLVALTTKRPQFEARRSVELAAGSNDYKSIGFDFTGPLTHNIAYRLVGLARDGDTQFDHVEETRYTLMPSLAINFSENTSLNLYAYLQSDPQSGYHGGLPASGTLYPHTNGQRISENFFEGEPGLDTAKREQQMFGYEFQHRLNDIWSVRQNFRYLDSEHTQEQVYAWGYDNFAPSPGYVPRPNELYRQYTGAEEALHSWIIDNMVQAEFMTGSAMHTLVMGIDYQRIKNVVDWTYGYPSNIDPFNPVYGNDEITYVSPFDRYSYLRRKEQTGAYIQDLIEVGRWNLSLGLRKDWFEVSETNRLDEHDPVTVAVTRPAGTENKLNDSKLTGRAGVLYQFDNGIAPFVSYSESFNPSTYSDAAGSLIEPSEGTQWELGVKYQPTGTDDLYTASLFHITQENVATKQASEDFYRNAGEVESHGLELEARFQLTDSLRLLGSYTFTEVEYTKPYFNRAADGLTRNVEGNMPAQTPEHMASLWADYRFNHGMLTGLSAGLGVRYMGESWADAENTAHVPSYTLYDASLSYDLTQVGLEGTRVRLNVNNLTDENYVASCGSLNFCYYGAERNVTATISYDF
ncbi:TonB-dependent siderophore receptor [Pseudomonas saudiphocaensis]|uniref:TonB-dependent siderophore receptor n=1 Tax=Pseudomonas saudiphocaensis TaxID=1499686 RepID=A0A078LV85_9PSED|nr:TonB-dependent siderophore receptor [Pseudomonas saudiphocaensis]CDZ95175.1 TonB-dependent siderophore receptor [Pseudomonas saudiphocaensis]